MNINRFMAHLQPCGSVVDVFSHKHVLGAAPERIRHFDVVPMALAFLRRLFTRFKTTGSGAGASRRKAKCHPARPPNRRNQFGENWI